MTFTLTSRLELPQWSSGSDGPSRTQLNDAFKRIDDRAAYDDGTSPTTLPVSGVVDGRYAQTVIGPYRQLYRRSGGAWAQVGGNAWAETLHSRADAALATTGVARQISHPGITNPTAVENWDGSSLRGNRQAIGDLNSGQPGALHVGDTISGVDLATRGRVFVRTTADGQRGLVAAAHGTGAGHLLAAQEPGGSVPWYVDAQGRMRAQAPTAHGAANLTAGVVLASAPGTGDTSAADLSAAAGKWALRAYRALGDSTAIFAVGQDTIALGRPSWTGAQISLTAPTISLTGAVQIAGNLTLTGGGTISSNNLPSDITFNSVVTNTLRANSTSTLAGVTASSLSTSGSVSAHGGLLATTGVGTGAELRTRPAAQWDDLTTLQSVRASMIHVQQIDTNLVVPQSPTATVTRNVVMPEDGWMRLDMSMYFEADQGLAGVETFKVLFRLDLLTTGGTVIWAGNLNGFTVTDDSPERAKPGVGTCHLTEVMPVRLNAGTYRTELRIARHGVLGGKLVRTTYMVTPVALSGGEFFSA